uniref:NADH-ubiquinone oxidoreductase chain 2 n=1 Tax=Pelecinus polyturator TaxID=44352 RepID=A0A0E3EKX6_9HYME|nr:NADH dehydrogenase subunit 2 [Pelecinus polyturator]AIW82467.1 NADH dehydrogenase subunit 2 [Pelecinus polyturator]
MYLNLYKSLFITPMLSLSTLISISSNSWFFNWMSLEINLLSFITLISIYNKSLNLMKYFLIQSFSSTIFLFFSLNMIILTKSSSNLLLASSYLMTLSLLIKLGIYPFHSWFISLMNNLNWINCMIISTWQKIIPLYLLNQLLSNPSLNYFIMLITLSNSTLSTIMTFNQTSLRSIMSLSSLNHLSWMLISMLNNKMIWMIYFINYSLISINLMLMFNKLNIFHINEFLFSNHLNKYYIILMLFSILSLGGMPPFFGFFNKWMVVEFNFYNLNFNFFFIILINSVMFLYFYIRTIFMLVLTFNYSFKYNLIMNPINFKNSLLIYMNLTFIFLFNIYFMPL